MRRKAVVKKFGAIFLTSAVFGAFAFSLPVSAEARRLHDPQVETKAQMHQTATRGGAVTVSTQRTAGGLTLNERIEKILHPEPAYQGVSVPETRSANDESIIGTPLASQQQCVKYLLSVNPRPNIAVSPEELVAYYYEEGRREGIRPDVAFAQALKETGFFSYGGTVTPDQNNYCGLGTTSDKVKGAYFASPAMGVRAHIQHLLAYASTRRPVLPVVDPRYNLVRNNYGAYTFDRWKDLNGRWAVPGNGYGQSIMSMFRAILRE